MLNRRGIDRNIDWVTFSLYLALVMLGWTMVYSTTYQEGQTVLSLSSPAGKQLLWTAISFAAFAVTMTLDWKFWQTFAYPIYALTLLGLVGVLIFGVRIKGQLSWYSIAGFTLQPSEFAKFGTALAMAAYLSTAGVNLKTTRDQLVAGGLILVPIFLIQLQPDTGSAIVFLSFLLVLYRQGLNSVYYILGGFVVAMLIIGILYEDYRFLWILLLSISCIWLGAEMTTKRTRWYFVGLLIASITIWGLSYEGKLDINLALYLFGAGFLTLAYFYSRDKKNIQLPVVLGGSIALGSLLAFTSNYIYYQKLLPPHQIDRISVWLHPSKSNPMGAGYNLIQSKMAISAGGLEGQGFMNGTITRLNYVPAQSTDFIISAVGEEQGFIGMVLVIGLFLYFLLSIIKIAERQRSTFSRVYAYSLVGILFIHVFINIGMTMGIMPVVGIPLPFISRGGTALLGFTIMIGVLLKLDSKRYQI